MWSGLTRSLKMSQEQSEEENGLVTAEDGQFDGETAEPEVIISLPRGSDPAPELVMQATPMGTGTVSADADTSDPGQHRRFGPLSGAKPKRFMDERSTLSTPGHSRPPPSTGTQPVTDRFMYERLTLGHGRPPPSTGTEPVPDLFMSELLTLPTPGHSRSLPRTGTQPVTDRSMYELPTLPTPVHNRPPSRNETQPVTDRFMYELPTCHPRCITGHRCRPPSEWCPRPTLLEMSPSV